MEYGIIMEINVPMPTLSYRMAKPNQTKVTHHGRNDIGC